MFVGWSNSDLQVRIGPQIVQASFKGGALNRRPFYAFWGNGVRVSHPRYFGQVK